MSAARSPAARRAGSAGADRLDRGAGSVLAIGILAVAVVLALTAIGLGAALAARERLAGATDNAALAAADVARGIVPGSPCAVARRVLVAAGASLDSCELAGTVVTVRASETIAGIPVGAAARAGPP